MMKRLFENWNKFLKEGRYPGLKLVPEEQVERIIAAALQKAPDKEKLKTALVLAHQSLVASVNDPIGGAPGGDEHALAKKIDIADNVLGQMPQATFDKDEALLIAQALEAMGLPSSYARAQANTIRRG
jgi:hypothetical protein